MKRTISVVLMTFTICLNVVAQDWAKAKPAPVDYSLKVGDKIPLTELHNMINYPKKTLKFSDHKPKLFILDFWGVNCTPCINFWPTLLELQAQFKNELQIITIDKYEREDVVKDLIGRRKRIAGIEMTLPTSCRDTATWRYFPQLDVPRYVWVSPDGIIGSITRSKEVNAGNIKKWISSGPFAMPQANETKLFVATPNQPLFVNGNGGERSSDVFIWTSSLTKGQNDLAATPVIFYNDSYGYGINVMNSSILDLYGYAYNNRLDGWNLFDYLPHSRSEVVSTDTSIYYQNKERTNIYNYQLLAGKAKSRDELISMMRADLDRYFGVEVRWEKRRKKCLVLSMFDSTLAKGKSLGGELSLKHDYLVVDSCSVKEVITYMEIASAYRYSWAPIIDETNFSGLITGIRAEGNASNPIELDKILSKYGIRLRYEMRDVEILVLRERNKQQSIK